MGAWVGPGRRRLSLRRRARRREDRRAEPDRGRGPDGHLAGLRHRRRAARAGLRRHPAARGLARQRRARRPTASCWSRDLFLEIGGQPVTTAERGRGGDPGEHAGGAARHRGAARPQAHGGHRGPRARRRRLRRSASSSAPGSGFPFDVSVNISPDIGGPSAGLMFSLAIYDTLTPGSLTDDEIVAGTGEIAPDGTVGPIGGIQQKIVGGPRLGRRAVPGAARTTATTALRRRQRRHAAGARRDHARARGWRSRPGPTTATPTCRAARTWRPRDRPRSATSTATRRWRPRSWRSSRTSPTAAGTSRPGSTRWSTPPSWCAREPALAAAMGLDAPSERGSLTAVEQDQIDPHLPLEQVLESIVWPDDVAGCAAVVERLVLPPARRRGDPGGPRERRRSSRSSTPTGRKYASSRERPDTVRRTVHYDCAPMTTTSPSSGAPTWCPGCWRCWVPP